MKKFKDFGITVSNKGFIGDKIKIQKVLNREITVHHFAISPSKVFEGKCLQLQISLNNELHVLFSGASGLIEAITQIPE